MPRGDGSGPEGAGPLTGRGLGPCSTSARGLGFGRRSFARGFRRGGGRGFGRGFWSGSVDERSDKELLQEQRELLKSQMEAIDDYLEKV
ncbi:MAG TPA: DUF5320 domain-containing protein [Clostridia bacterium]|nr:DUF5320 domain-containing protein [Clostridia bacterium]